MRHVALFPYKGSSLEALEEGSVYLGDWDGGLWQVVEVLERVEPRAKWETGYVQVTVTQYYGRKPHMGTYRVHEWAQDTYGSIG